MKIITATTICFLLIVIVLSCKKEQPGCKGNCFTAIIKGRLYDKINLAGLANIPVEAEWRRKANCIGCTVYTISAGKTDDRGNFDLSKEIDTAFFKDYYLSIKIPLDSNYFYNLSEAENRFSAKRFYDFDSAALRQVNFEFYPKVPLTIRLRRTQQDNFVNYSVGHSFATNFAGSYYSFYNPLVPVDTVIRQQTAPGVFTKIFWRKNLAGNTFTEGADSIVCTPSGNNTIEVDF